MYWNHQKIVINDPKSSKNHMKLPKNDSEPLKNYQNALKT